MGSQSFQQSWSKFELMTKEEDVSLFPFPTQLNPLDFSCGYLECAALDSGFDFAYQGPLFDASPLMEMPASYDLSFSSLDIDQTPCMLQGNLWHGFGNDFRIWNETIPELDNQNRQMPMGYSNIDEQVNSEELVVKLENKGNERWPREEKGISSSKNLSRKTISKYFYMPITRAAKELNIGLTLLKKRCRELGIRRWPHRKLMSLQTLIKNVQEMEKEEGQATEQKLKGAIMLLEHEKKMLEEVPDMQLEDKTKRLRQACFKANYKKRKLMGMVESQSQPVSPIGVNPKYAHATAPVGFKDVGNDAQEGIIQTLFSDCFSSTNTIF